MVLNGRHPLDWESISLITLHMAAIGLVIALIVVMDEPSRGKSSASSVPIINAVCKTGDHAIGDGSQLVGQ